MHFNRLDKILHALFTLAILASFSFTQTGDSQAHHDEPTSVSVSAGGASVAMDIYVNKPVVDVKINGQGPFKMFLDTGAGATVLNKALADELKLPTNGTVTIGDPKDPHGITADKRTFDKLSIGDAEFDGFEAVSWDRSNLYKPGSPQGVIGMPLFRKLLLTIDYPANKVVISKGSLATGPDVISYETGIAGLFKVPVTVAGKAMKATIDSGSMGGFSFPESYKDMLPLVDKPVEVGRGRTVAGEAIIYGAKLKGDISIGGITSSGPNIRFFDRLTDPNIGFEFLHLYTVTVDQPNKRIRFLPAEKAAASIAESPLDSFVGTYGVRNIRVENGHLVLQRMSGPQGVGPEVALDQISPGEFAFEGTRDVRVKFVRDDGGSISGLMVLNPQGQWETAPKGAAAK